MREADELYPDHVVVAVRDAIRADVLPHRAGAPRPWGVRQGWLAAVAAVRRGVLPEQHFPGRRHRTGPLSVDPPLPLGWLAPQAARMNRGCEWVPPHAGQPPESVTRLHRGPPGATHGLRAGQRHVIAGRHVREEEVQDVGAGAEPSCT